MDEKKKSMEELETWFKRDLRRESPGKSMTPASQTDENDIDQKFEELLIDVNLNEEQKDAFSMYSHDSKTNMLVMQQKLAGILKTKEFVTPDQYISFLETANANHKSNDKILNCLESLRLALTYNTLSWVHEFGSRGLQAIFDVLQIETENNGNDDDTYETIQVECLKCIAKFCDHAQGVEEFVRAHAGHVVIANCIDYRKPAAMIAALHTLSLLGFVDNKEIVSSSKLLSVLEKLGNLRKCNRFVPVIEGITMSKNDDLSVACLQFFNVLLAQATDLECRKFLRNEIVGNGLGDKLDELKNHPTVAISKQFGIFESDEYQNFEKHSP